MPAPNWNNTDWLESGNNIPTWDVDGSTPIPQCGNAGQTSYGDAYYYPQGGWEVGYRPTTVTIDITVTPVDQVIGSLSIYAGSGGVSHVLTGETFPLDIDISSLDGDIYQMTFEDIHGEYFDGFNFVDFCTTINSVVFSGTASSGNPPFIHYCPGVFF